MLTIEQARNNLTSIMVDGRITTSAGPLTGREMLVLQQSIELLYSAAKEKEEDKKCQKSKKK